MFVKNIYMKIVRYLYNIVYRYSDAFIITMMAILFLVFLLALIIRSDYSKIKMAMEKTTNSGQVDLKLLTKILPQDKLHMISTAKNIEVEKMFSIINKKNFIEDPFLASFFNKAKYLLIIFTLFLSTLAFCLFTIYPVEKIDKNPWYYVGSLRDIVMLILLTEGFILLLLLIIINKISLFVSSKQYDHFVNILYNDNIQSSNLKNVSYLKANNNEFAYNDLNLDSLTSKPNNFSSNYQEKDLNNNLLQGPYSNNNRVEPYDVANAYNDILKNVQNPTVDSLCAKVDALIKKRAGLEEIKQIVLALNQEVVKPENKKNVVVTNKIKTAISELKQYVSSMRVK